MIVKRYGTKAGRESLPSEPWRTRATTVKNREKSEMTAPQRSHRQAMTQPRIVEKKTELGVPPDSRPLRQHMDPQPLW